MESTNQTNGGRMYDFVIFGATGFTGRFVAEQLYLNQKKNNTAFTCALAGRAASLEKLFKSSSKEFAEHFGRIVADCSDEPSITEMCKSARVVINCVGPFRTFGEIVVKNCVENGADYVDISGEPEFLELMEFKYNELAKKNNVSIIGACGFDSVPADFGVELLRQHCLSNGLTLTSVETFLKVSGGERGVGAHFTTFQCAVEGMSRAQELTSLRKRAAAERRKRLEESLKNPLDATTVDTSSLLSSFNTWSDKEKETLLKTCGAKLGVQAGPFDHEKFEGYKAFAFPGADASVIRRSFQRRTEELLLASKSDGGSAQSSTASVANTNFNGVSPQIACYFVVPSAYNRSMMVKGGLMKMLSGYSFGRSLLLSYPSFFTNGIFTREGPSKEQIESMTYEFTFVGKAIPADSIDLETLSVKKDAAAGEATVVTMKWKGGDPGYVSTSRILLACAVTLLQAKTRGEEKESGNAVQNGFSCGVLTPGFAFANTTSKNAF